jgi:hypothetical protein
MRGGKMMIENLPKNNLKTGLSLDRRLGLDPLLTAEGRRRLNYNTLRSRPVIERVVQKQVGEISPTGFCLSSTSAWLPAIKRRRRS